MTPAVIVITGASGGLGAALAKTYANPGVTLGLIARNNDKLQLISNECEQLGANVLFASIDVTDTETLQRWISDFDQNTPIDLLIANAGVTSGIGKNGEAESWSAISKVLDINLYGVVASIYPLIEPMRKRKAGQIALVSSLAAYRGLPITPSYCASKAGVKVYGEALRGWLAEEGVKVSVICPGFVKSAMSDQFEGDKPFLITADKAASIIKSGLGKNKARISFPFPLNLGTWFLMLLPSFISDLIIDRISYGARRKDDKL